MKAGWKTTEFYITVLTIGALVLSELSNANILPTKYAALGAGLAAAGYAVARGLAKLGKPGT